MEELFPKYPRTGGFPLQDEQIVERYWARDESAVEETARKYGAYCHSIAYGVLQNHEDAEEAVNDAYLGAWNSIPPHRPTVLSAFLGKLTRRAAVDKWRERNAAKRGGGEMPLALDELEACVAGGDSAESAWEQEELKRLINGFVRSLPQAERRVFLCRYWELLSVGDIGARFGYSQSKVKSMLYRSREKLKKQLTKEGFL